MRRFLLTALLTVGMNLPTVVAPVKAFSIAIVGSADIGSNSGTCAGSIATVGASHTAGNLLVAVGFHGGTSATVTITSTNNTWLPSGLSLGGKDMYYSYNINGGSDTVTASWSGSRTACGVGVYEFSGFGGSNPYESNALNNSGSGTTLTTGTLSITNPAVIVAGMSGVSNFTAGSGYVRDMVLTNAYGIEWHIVSANEAATATQTTGAWSIVGASFTTAGGGGSTFPAAIINSPIRGGGRGVR